ncbi:MAG: hypothetical protein WA230_22475, partial [Xanthobacteraceae bacterium]
MTLSESGFGTDCTPYIALQHILLRCNKLRINTFPKTSHFSFQNRPLSPETGQYRLEAYEQKENILTRESSRLRIDSPCGRARFGITVPVAWENAK